MHSTNHQPETPAQRLEKAAAVVAEWRGRVAALTTKIAQAETAAANSTRQRQDFVLGASLGNGEDQRELDRLRREHDTAQLAVSDFKLALPLAQAELEAAIGAHKNAENEIRQLTVLRLARERVGEAVEIDKALALVARHWAKYEEIGDALSEATSHGVGGGYNMSAHEGIRGLVRFAAALPKLFLDLRKNHPMADFGICPLAKSESAHWNLPPIEEGKEGKAA